MGRIFINDDQLKEWVEAAEGIEERFGVGKALGYLVGEKFYSLVSILHSARKIISAIDSERKQPGYNPVRITKYLDRETETDLDEIYEKEKEIILEAQGLLANFAALIRRTFSAHEIRRYLDSNPRLGIHGHTSTDEEYDSLVSKGLVEHTLDTEIEDALIFGDILKHFEGS